MKILNFGSCNLDYVYTLDHIVSGGETESTDSFSVFPGGKGLNQSVAAAKGGATVFHAGCVGNNGDLLREILTESGVDVSCLETVDCANGHAVIQVSRGGENSIFLYGGSNERITEEQIDRVLSRFEEGDLLLLQNEVNLVPYMVERAYARGLKIVLNPSPYNGKILAIDFSRLSYLILNEVEGRALSGYDEPEACVTALRRRYPDLTVVLTLGEKGCILCRDDRFVSQPAYEVEVVDTTAAGDTFTGFFLASLSMGCSDSDALRIASAASALAVSRRGAAPSIPYREEVVKRLPFLKPKEERVDSAEEQRRRISAYMEQHLQDASLEGLARCLGYSAAYTGTLVKRRFSLPFSKLLHRFRCAYAANCLAETEDSVAEIIHRIGYKNESFFRKLFRERYSVSPVEYRKMKRGEEL